MEDCPRLRGLGGLPSAVGSFWVAGLLFLSGSSALAKVKSDWSKVQAVSPGQRTAVLLYKDKAAPGDRKIRGRFDSANADTITLMVEGGRSRTLERQAIRRVLVTRPISKRLSGWIALGVVGGALQAFMSRVDATDNLSAVHMAQAHAIGTLPFGAFALYRSRMGGIYNVPPQYRVPSTLSPT